MELHDSLLSALENTEGHSGINLFCAENELDSVKGFFLDRFKEEYNNLLNFVESTFGDCSEKEDDYNPIEGIVLNGTSVCVLLGNLDLHYRDYSCRPIVGTKIITGDDALENTIDALKKQFPDIRYEGYIGYFISDAKYGEPYQYELSSEKTIETGKSYDFLGRALSKAIEDDDFWEGLSEQLSFGELDDFKGMIDCFKAYDEYLQEDTYYRLLDIADEVNEDFRDSLEEYMSII